MKRKTARRHADPIMGCLLLQKPFEASEQVRDALRRGHLPQARIADGRPPVWLTPPPLNLDDAQSAFAKQSSAAMLRSTSVSFLSTIKVGSLLTALQYVQG